jgi:hypothetical protein
MHRKLLVLMLSLVIGLGLVPLAPDAEAATEDWVLEGQMPFGLSEFVSAKLPDGRLFVGLGYDPSTEEYSDRAYLFDPYEMTWDEVATPRLPAPGPPAPISTEWCSSSEAGHRPISTSGT